MEGHVATRQLFDEWMIALHNTVNASTGKPELPLPDALKLVDHECPLDRAPADVQ